MSFIKRRLLSDWDDINFIIGSNPDDYIELRFQVTTDDVPTGLHAYLNVLIDQDEYLTKFCLSKVVEYWGVTSGKQSLNSREVSSRGGIQSRQAMSPLANVKAGDYVYYMIAPSWARKQNPVLYLM